MPRRLTFSLLFVVALVTAFLLMVRPAQTAPLQTPEQLEQQIREKIAEAAAEQRSERTADAAHSHASKPSAAAPHPVAPGAAAAAIHDFQQWLEQWQRGSRGLAAASRGEQLAQRRREHMAALIKNAPELALELAVPRHVWATLLPEIQAQLETPFSTTGKFELIIACDLHDGHSETFRAIEVDGKRFNGFTYGHRLDITSKNHLPMHGIHLGNDAAVAATAVRIVPAEERKPARPGAVLLDIGGRLREAASSAEAEQIQRRIEEQEKKIGPDLPVIESLDPSSGVSTTETSPAAESAWTEGAKTLLYIRARFADESESFEPITVGSAETNQSTVDSFFQNASYGKTSIASTITNAVTLPKNASEYTNAFATLLADARAAAKAANPSWDYLNYNLYCVVTSNKGSFSYAGKAYVGDRGAHLRSDSATLRTAGHEFGHNYGLRHANFWRTDNTDTVGRDSVPGGYVSDNIGNEWIQYGHRFSIMSAQSGSTTMNIATFPHPTAQEKRKLDWLTASDVAVVSADNPTPVRMYRQDHIDATGKRAIHVDVPATDYTTSTISSKRRYWLNYRRAWTNGTFGTWSQSGIVVEWGRNTYGSDGAIQLDMTPFSNDVTTYIDQSNLPGSYWTVDNADKEDGVLLIGRTYSDPAGNIHITTVGAGGTNEGQYMDVVVRIGTFTTNKAPALTLNSSSLAVAPNTTVTFTAAATDADGDTLAYGWDWGDKSIQASALNSSIATKSWATAGVYTVRSVVSDMKGGVAIQSQAVAVGFPTSRYKIRGRVLSSGNPVVNARVFIDAARHTWTDSDGSFVLSGLSSGSYMLQAVKSGTTFQAQFTNPVSVGSSIRADAVGLNFHATGTSTPEKLTVSPFPAYIARGAQVQFSAIRWNTGGQPSSTNATWSVNGGGSINSDGLFTAGDAAGTYVVTATAPGATAGQAWVVVDAVLPTVQVTSPAAGAYVEAGVTTTLAATAQDSDGTISQVEFFVNGSSLGVKATAPYSISWTPQNSDTYTITARARDNWGNVTEALPQVITVTTDKYDLWRYSKFSTYPGGMDSPDAADTADPEGDGVSNLLEFAFGLEPLIHDAAPTDGTTPGLPLLGKITVDGIDYFTLTYRRLLNSGLTYQPQKNRTLLENWSDVAPAEDELLSSGGGWETRRARLPLDGEFLFLRLRVVR